MAVRKRAWRTTKRGKGAAWTVDFLDEKGRRVRRQFGSKREAEAFRAETDALLHGGTYRADAERVTVKEAAGEFLIYCRGRMERRERMTRHHYNTLASHIRHYVCPEKSRTARQLRHVCMFEAGLAHMTLRQLSARAVGEFRDRLRLAGLSIPMTRKVLGTLRLILGYAISRDLIAVNVAMGVRVIGRRDEGSKVIVAPSKDAVRQLLATASPDFRTVILFASATGLRASELHALRWRHLDFQRCEVRVETRVDQFGEEDVTKSFAGTRTVPLGASVFGELAAWKERTYSPKASDLVFPGRSGGYQNHCSMLRCEWRPLFATMADRHREHPETVPAPPHRFTWHALRHFAISTWIEAGLSPKTVQTFAGHSSLEMTMDRYGHLFPSDDHRIAMDRIARGLT